MRVIFFLVFLLVPVFSIHAGTSQCQGVTREYVYLGLSPHGEILYEVYCINYPNPSSFSTGPGGGISVPTIDFTLVKKLPFSIFNIKL